MQDIFDQVILCNNCRRETTRTKTLKEGFELRAWECQKCNFLIYHPGDLRDYEEYKKLRKQDFNVKLRMVGNSFCVSIPKEIIDFHQEMEREMEKEFQQLVRLTLEEPGKIGMFFFNRKSFLNKK